MWILKQLILIGINTLKIVLLISEIDNYRLTVKKLNWFLLLSIELIAINLLLSNIIKV